MTYWYIGFYLPPFLALALAVVALGKPAYRSVCGSAALWGLGLGTLAFLVGFIGPMFWSPDSNLGPLMGFFVGPYGFILGCVIGFAVGLARRRRPDDGEPSALSLSLEPPPAPQRSAPQTAPQNDAYLPEPPREPI